MEWRFELRLDSAEIPALSARFGSTDSDEALERELVPAARAQGYLTKPQFLRLAEWKSPRARPHYERNEADAVERATGEALASSDERRRVEALTGLSGVGYPVASVILHWVHPDGYPVLDFRAARAVGIERIPSGSFAFWLGYTHFCRGVAQRNGVSMRELDRALWQFDREVNPPIQTRAASAIASSGEMARPAVRARSAATGPSSR
jgi:hypothetical protein